MRALILLEIAGLLMAVLPADLEIELIPGPREKKKLADAPKAVNAWEGYWHVEGEERGGKRYEGVVTVHKISDVYIAFWTVGPLQYEGVGIVNGKALALSWGYGKARGITVMERKGAGAEGVWSMAPGNAAVNREAWTFLRALGKAVD